MRHILLCLLERNYQTAKIKVMDSLTGVSEQLQLGNPSNNTSFIISATLKKLPVKLANFASPFKLLQINFP